MLKIIIYMIKKFRGWCLISCSEMIWEKIWLNILTHGENDSSNNSYSSYYQTLKSIYEIYNYIAVLNVIKPKCMPKKNRTLVLELRIPRSPIKKKINL